MRQPSVAATVNLPPTPRTHTPRSSPGLRSSPKHRGGRVTFDASSRNSSPRSRSSREKDEEAFRSTVAQSLCLSSSSPKLRHKETSKNSSESTIADIDSVQQNLKGSSSPIQKLRDKFIADNTIATTSSPNQKVINNSDTAYVQLGRSDRSIAVDYIRNFPPRRPEDEMSRRDDEGYDTPERDVVPTGPYVPSPTLDPPDRPEPDNDDDIGVDPARDGMKEYASGYKEPTTTRKLGTSEGLVVGVADQQDNVSTRRELREPDGASGSSSPAALPQTQCKQGGRDAGHTKQKGAASAGRRQAGDIHVPLLSADPKTSADSKTAQQAEVPDIPSTNIAVAFLVTLCFNLPLGIVAIYFSLMATKAYRDGDKVTGSRRARISIYISLFSIVLTVLIVMAVVLYRAVQGQARQMQYTKTGMRL